MPVVIFIIGFCIGALCVVIGQEEEHEQIERMRERLKKEKEMGEGNE